MGDLWLLPVGRKPVQLTDDPAVEIDPAWSPDGTQLAFASDRGGTHGSVGPRSPHEQRAAGHDASGTASRRGVVAATAQHIAYLVNRRELQRVSDRAGDRRWRHRHDGLPSRELGRPTWAPDCRSVAVGALFPVFGSVSRRAQSAAALFVRATARGPQSVLFPQHSAGNRESNGPVWSPDGLHMAFVTEGRCGWSASTPRAAPSGPPTRHRRRYAGVAPAGKAIRDTSCIRRRKRTAARARPTAARRNRSRWT